MDVNNRGNGRQISAAGSVIIICTAAQTDGRLCVFDQTFEVGQISLAHSHQNETQGAFILEGSIGFWTDGEETVGSPGDYVIRPRGSVHAVWNAGDEPARMLEVTTPAEEFEKFILALSEARESGDASAGAMEGLGERIGTRYRPDLTEELKAKHALG
jgi:quercetin dioxygenase-like cupin family protein